MNKVKVKLLYFTLTFLPSLIQAAPIPGPVLPAPTPTSTCSYPKVETIFGCLKQDKNILEIFVTSYFLWVAGIIGTLAMLGLILAGFTYSTANGNPDQIKKAKDIVITSLTGLIIILLAYALFAFMGIAEI